jgi:hypothetical protein
MPKDSNMRYTASTPQPPVLPPATPWSLRAWPPLLWQAGEAAPVRFHHLGTRVTLCGDSPGPTAGQTVWAAKGAEGEAGMAWDWVQIARGVVAMADPMAVVTNLRLVGTEGEVLTAHEAACFLNELVRSLPWQQEVRRALSAHVN